MLGMCLMAGVVQVLLCVVIVGGEGRIPLAC
jgi:hypothetical protein